MRGAAQPSGGRRWRGGQDGKLSEEADTADREVGERHGRKVLSACECSRGTLGDEREC